ncbi:hypothetical protein Tco_0422404 [Tanacetum coccineum]
MKLSWGIPLVNAGELPEMDPYEEVSLQGQAPPLSPAYVPDPIELDEHVPVEDQPYAEDASPAAESPGYIANSDSMEEDTDADSIDYPDEPEDGDEDPEEDDDEDPNEEHEHEDEDTKVEEPSEGSDKTEPFEEDETAALIDAFATGSPPFPLPPTSPAYDQAPLGHRAAMIPESSAAAAARAPRAADRAENVGYVRALHASKHRMMTFIKEVNLRVSYQAQVRMRESEDFYTQLHDARTDRRDIRLEIDVVRG